MKPRRATLHCLAPRPGASFCAALLAVFFLAEDARAWKWNQAPQPLIGGPPDERYAITADPRSPLAFHSKWKLLFFVHYGLLAGNMWTGRSFERIDMSTVRIKPGTALVLNETWHHLYAVNDDDRLVFCWKLQDGSWSSLPMLDEPISEVLAVDEKWQVVYAYSEERQAILAIHWTGEHWVSEAVVESAGVSGGEGVFDPKNQILYSSHATFDSDLPPLESCDAAPGLPAWPVVATWWDGATWRSRVVAETGVPQRPAWDPKQSRLYFAVWNQPDALRVIELGNPREQLTAVGLDPQPLNLRKTSKRSLTSGWLPFAYGLRTWTDNTSYPIDYKAVAKYGKHLGDSYGYSSEHSWFSPSPPPLPSDEWVPLSAHVPAWSSTAMPERVSSWSGLVSSTRRELLHQASLHQGGSVQVATGWVTVPELYGVYPRHRFNAAENQNPADFGYYGYFLWTPDWHDEIPAEVLPLVTVEINGKIFPKPSVFKSEFIPTDWTWYYSTDIRMGQVGSKAKAHLSDSAITLTSGDVVGNPSLPLPPPRLAGASSSIRTSGSRLAQQPIAASAGGRFLDYPSAAANRAWTGGLAADRRSSFVFYTQAPQVKAVPRSPGGRLVVSNSIGAVDYDASADEPTLVTEGPVWVSVLFSKP